MAKTNLFRNADNAEAFSAGQTIFEEGQTGEVAYVVKEGEVEILISDAVLETLTAGDVFGEMALIEHKGRSATARARTDCQVVPVDARQFAFLVQQTPQFALVVMQTMAERLRAANQRGR